MTRTAPLLLAASLALTGCVASQHAAVDPSDLPLARPVIPLAVDDGGARDDWKKTQLIYPSGAVVHPVNYFDEIGHTDHDPVTARTTETMLRKAMDGAQPGLWNRQHALEALTQPASFGVDVAMLPIRAVFYRPWELSVTPSER